MGRLDDVKRATTASTQRKIGRAVKALVYQLPLDPTTLARAGGVAFLLAAVYRPRADSPTTHGGDGHVMDERGHTNSNVAALADASCPQSPYSSQTRKPFTTAAAAAPTIIHTFTAQVRFGHTCWTSVKAGSHSQCSPDRGFLGMGKAHGQTNPGCDCPLFLTGFVGAPWIADFAVVVFAAVRAQRTARARICASLLRLPPVSRL